MAKRFKDIKLLALDVDGVLTDDHIYFGSDGFEMKKTFFYPVIPVLIGMSLYVSTTAIGDEYDYGKKLYQEKCQLCHGVKGEGNGPAATSLSPRPANFTAPEFWKGNVEQKITNTVLKGKGVMPAFQLSPGHIKALIDFMSHTFKKSN